MSTLCTQASSSLSTGSDHCCSSVVEPAQASRAPLNATTTLAKIVHTITQYVVTRYNQRIDRQAFKNVMTLDDRTLKDIGVTRQDVMWASRLPLSEDAAIKLTQIARRR